MYSYTIPPQAHPVPWHNRYAPNFALTTPCTWNVHCKLPTLPQDVSKWYLLSEGALTILLTLQPTLYSQHLGYSMAATHSCVKFISTIKSIIIKCNYDWSDILNCHNKCHLLCLWSIASRSWGQSCLCILFIKIAWACWGQCLAQKRHFKNFC